MDRVTTLRNLMKTNAPNGNNSIISGKEKSKLLKQMKKQSNTSIIQNNIIADYSNKKIGGEQNNMPQSVVHKQQNAVANEPKSFDFPKAVPMLQKTKIPDLPSDLPEGFFDDPVELNKANGIDINEQQNKEQEELNNFMNEIQKVTVDNEVIEEENEFNENETSEINEEMIQMAYVARLAQLYHKSDFIPVVHSIPEQVQRDTLSPLIIEKGKLLNESKELKELIDNARPIDVIESTSANDSQQSDDRIIHQIKAKLLNKRKLDLRDDTKDEVIRIKHDNKMEHLKKITGHQEEKDEEEGVDDDEEDDDENDTSYDWMLRSI